MGHKTVVRRMDKMKAETIGQRLRRLRTERGLSQRDLQVKGVSYAYISRIEADARSPSVKALRKLAPLLGVTAEYLEFGEERTLSPELILKGRYHLQRTVEALRELADEMEEEGNELLKLAKREEK